LEQQSLQRSPKDNLKVENILKYEPKKFKQKKFREWKSDGLFTIAYLKLQ
jgi:hypothetical protein